MSEITDKIRKLFALACSPNENEARLAMAKAQELLIKHGIKDFEKENAGVKAKEKEIYYGFRKVTFLVKLMFGVLAKEYGCKAYTTSETVLIVGPSESAIDCCYEAISYAINAAKRNWQRYWDGLPGKGRRTRSMCRKSYEYGFCYGILESNQDHRDLCDLPALVVPTVIEEHAEQKYKVKEVCITKKHKVSKHDNHALRGYVDGKAQKINKQIQKEADNG